MTEAILLTMMNPPPDGDAEFNAWADTEHLPERRTIPGIRTALRFRNKATSPRYMAIYDLEDIAVLQSPAYLAIAGDNLSPWSKRILADASARWRFEGSRIGGWGRAALTCEAEQTAELLLVQWRAVPQRCDDTILSTLHAALAELPGILQWRAFVGQRNGLIDYVGIAESDRTFDVRDVDPARFATALLGPGDFTHAFLPI